MGWIDDLKPGDYVVHTATARYEVAKVARTTKTLVIMSGGKSFSKKSGKSGRGLTAQWLMRIATADDMHVVEAHDALNAIRELAKWSSVYARLAKAPEALAAARTLAAWLRDNQ